MLNIRQKVAITLIILLLMIAALGFSTFLNVISFYNNHVDSVALSNSISAQKCVNKLEYSLKYGKSLSGFIGIGDLLAEIKKETPSISNVTIYDLNGNMLYDGIAGQEKKILDAKKIRDFDIVKNANLKAKKITVHEIDGFFHTFLPINDKNGSTVGIMDAYFRDNGVKQTLNTHIITLVKWLLFMVFIGGIIFSTIIFKVKIVKEDRKFIRNKLLLIIISLLTVFQLIFGLVNFQLFRSAYTNMAEDNAKFLSAFIKNDIEKVLNKGVAISEVSNFELYLNDIKKTVYEVDKISIEGKNVKISSTDSVLGKDASTDQKNLVEYRDVQNSLGSDKYKLSVTISNSKIMNKLDAILLDFLTVLIISFFFTYEIVTYVISSMEKTIQKIGSPGWAFKFKDEAIEKITYKKQKHGSHEKTNAVVDDNDDNLSHNFAVLRLWGFVAFAAVVLYGSFIPILSRDLYNPFKWISPNIASGLPISVEMLFTALGAFFIGKVFDSISWKKIFSAGFIIFVIGNILSAISGNLILFIISRAIAGVGFAFLIMTIRVIIVSIKKPQVRTRGIVTFNAGAVAGQNAGIVVGAMLAERTGFAVIFIIAAAMILASGTFFLANYLNIKQENDDKEAIENTNSAKINTVRNTIKINKEAVSPKVNLMEGFLYIVLIFIPMYVAEILPQYFLPIFAQDKGISIADIGRIFLVCGILYIYVGPLLTKLIGKYFEGIKALVISAILIACAFMSLLIFSNIWSVVIVLVVHSIVSSFSGVFVTECFLELEFVKKLAVGRVMSLYSTFGNLGKMIGPIILGGLFAFGYTNAVGITGGIIIVSTLVFCYYAGLKSADIYESEAA